MSRIGKLGTAGRLALGLLAMAAGGRAQETTDAPKSTVARIAGRWSITYEDFALGLVGGSARIFPDGRVSMVLTHPATGAKYQLTGKAVAGADNSFDLKLQGESPAADKLPYSFSGGPARFMVTSTEGPEKGAGSLAFAIPAETKNLRVHFDDFHGEVAVKPRHPPDSDRVEIHLALEHYAVAMYGYAHPNVADTDIPIVELKGTWKYYADPVTWRDGKGRGRLGSFRRDLMNPNIATEEAVETWTRAQPKMLIFACTADVPKLIDRIYYNVPTFVELLYEDPPDETEQSFNIEVGSRKLQLTAKQLEKDKRVYRTEVFDVVPR
jgi:hypothetical protein